MKLTSSGVCQVLRKQQYRLKVDFWRGYNIDTLGSFKIAAAYLTEDEGRDTASLGKLIVGQKGSYAKIMRFIQKSLADLDLYSHSQGVTVKNLRLMRSDEVKKLLEILNLRDCHKGIALRGMPEGSLIISENFFPAIRASGNEGYRPSMPTSHIEYPDAIYRDGDLGEMLVSSGAPRVVHGRTPEEPGYPIKFSLVNKLPRVNNNTTYYIALKYRLVRDYREQRSGAVL